MRVRRNERMVRLERTPPPPKDFSRNDAAVRTQQPGNRVETRELPVKRLKRRPFKPRPALTFGVNEPGKLKELRLHHPALNEEFPTPGQTSLVESKSGKERQQNAQNTLEMKAASLLVHSPKS
jgi:hypothetical protein